MWLKLYQKQTKNERTCLCARICALDAFCSSMKSCLEKRGAVIKCARLLSRAIIKVQNIGVQYASQVVT